MLSKKSAEFADLLVNKNVIPYEKRNIIAHGITVMVELILNIVTTLILGVIFGLILESIIFLIAYSSIRMYTNGYHCKTSVGCYMFSCGIIIIFLSSIKFVILDNLQIVTLVSTAICIPIILKIAPINTKTRMLDKVEKTYFRKIMVRNLTIEISVIVILLLLNMPKYALIVSLSILVTTILLVVQKALNIKYKI